MKKHTGFTLIEVLIAMLLLAVGLLGLAALQTSTLRSNLAAYNHGQSIQLLYDMADKMRANSTVNKIVDTTLKSCAEAAKPCSYFIANSEALDDKTVSSFCTATTAPASCIPEVLAGNDLIEWNNAIAATLPMGRGRISLENGVFVLYVTWDDDRSGTVTTDDPRFTTSGGTFTTYVAPSSGIFHDPIFSMSLQP